MIDPAALVALEMAPRLVAEQLSEARPARSLPRKDPSGQPVRVRAARALRVVADALESSPESRPAG